MDKVMSEQQLREVLDRTTREVTERSTGIRLVQGNWKPEGKVCTVHIRFRRGFQSSLSVRVDAAMLVRLARSMLREKRITAQDLEDVAKEYLNVLCGHIAAAVYKTTRVAARFSVPTFHWEHYSPEDHTDQIVLNYLGDRQEAAQLIHHVPALPAGDRGGAGS